MSQSTPTKVFAFKDEPCEIGIDEAGRGPVLGPMVYGCCFWPIRASEEMKKEFGFTDSKQLKEHDRERLFNEIQRMEYSRLGYFTTVLDAQYLSNRMLAEYKRGGKNLNTLSHDTAIDLINKVKALGVNVKKVILDTVGQPESYKRLLTQRLRDEKLEIIVESKADFTFPVVSAASICAKVIRDRNLSTWEFPEASQFGNEFGCGYPSDPKTKEWLKSNFDEVFGYPSLVRFSWKTCYSVLEEKKMNLEWFDKIEDPKNDFKKNQKKLEFKAVAGSVTKESKSESQVLREKNRALELIKPTRNVRL